MAAQAAIQSSDGHLEVFLCDFAHGATQFTCSPPGAQFVPPFRVVEHDEVPR